MTDTFYIVILIWAAHKEDGTMAKKQQKSVKSDSEKPKIPGKFTPKLYASLKLRNQKFNLK